MHLTGDLVSQLMTHKFMFSAISSTRDFNPYMQLKVHVMCQVLVYRGDRQEPLPLESS